MNIAVIGATGFVGPHVVREALEREHQVTALARHPEHLQLDHPNLIKQAVDVRNEDELARLLQGQEAVLSAFNAGWQNPNLYEDFLAGARSIQRAAKRAGVGRLLVIGGAGSLYLAPGQQLVDSAEFPAQWKPGATAARDYLNELRQEQDLDWTFLSPAIELHPGERTGKYQFGTEHPVFDQKGRCHISVEDLAVALVDELEAKRFHRQRFTVGYSLAEGQGA